MNTPSYIAPNPDELFEKASLEIQDLIGNGDLDAAVQHISETYAIKEEYQVALSNVISFILIQAISSDDIIQALQDLVNVDGATAIKIATDLEHGILEKAHISLLSQGKTSVTTLEFQGEKNQEELRKELFDTTKRESALTKSPLPTPFKKPPTVIKPGSRSQLLEQLNVLSTIPNEEEITTRLSHIQEQIATMKKEEEDNSLDSKIALKSFMFGEKGKAVASSTVNKTTYSVPPTKYNVDPYREVDVP